MFSISKLVSKVIFVGERASIRDATGINIARYQFALDFCKGKKVLEFGCGVGYGTYYLTRGDPKHISAYDGDKAAIKYAKEHFINGRIDYDFCEIEKLKLKDKVDVIISFEVIEHLKSPEILLELARNTLKKRGVFLISTINRALSAYDNDKPSNPYHFQEYYADEFEKLLKKYFPSVTLYGIVLKNTKVYQNELKMRKSLKWKLASRLAGQRIIRRLLHYLPEKPKRFITGESKISFKPQDFELSNRVVENIQYLYAICKA